MAYYTTLTHKVRALPISPEISEVHQLSSRPSMSTQGIAFPYGLETSGGRGPRLSLVYRVFEWVAFKQLPL